MKRNGNVSQYLRQAQNSAMESFVGADGFFDDDVHFTGSDDFYGADGVNPVAAATSMPYAINITNTGAAVNNFELLGSAAYLNNAGFTAGGSLVIGTITISSLISGITYREMLYQFQGNPFSVGLTYIQSDTAGQLIQPITLNTRDANGTQAQKPFMPLLDPYQNQNNVVVVKQPYRVDGMTRMILSSVLANAVINFYIYPSDNINLARGLAGKPVSRNFGNPAIVKAQPVTVVGNP